MLLAGAIFDLDGTIIDTLPIVIQAFRKAITRFVDRSYMDDEIINLFGPSEEGVLRKVLPDRWEEGLAVYLNEYETHYTQRNIQPYPGIEDALQLLKKREIHTAIVTGKGAYSTAFSLRHAGLEYYFDLVQTGSAEGSVKPRQIKEVLSQWAIEPITAFYLGDSPSDIQDARRSGVIPLAAAWAEISTWDELNAQNPQAIFTTPQEFLKWIAGNLN
jgi:phosphoglycolate phosphatase-like HAD superfamily hydrolase